MRLAISVLALVWASSGLAVSVDEIRKAVVKIHTRHNPPSYLQPWNSQKPSYSTGTGFFIEGQKILTNAHVVGHGSDIEIELDDLGSKLPARVLHIAHDADLALLELVAPLASKRPHLTLKGMAEVRDEVLTVGYPKGGDEVSFTQGIVSRVSYRSYAHSPTHQHLLVQVDSAINSGNSGGPVLRGDDVIGVAFQAHSNAENTGYIIPTPVVNRFLVDVKDGRYDGHPYQGLLYIPSKLENPALRKQLGLSNGQQGVVIEDLMVGSPWQGVLEPGDTLSAIDGKEIKRDGTIDAYGESLSFQSLLDLRQIGETIKVKRVRDGKVQTVTMTIGRKASGYDFRRQWRQQPAYFILAGLMFRPLSRNLLATFGRAWYQSAPLHLRQLQFYGFNEPPYDQHQDFVVLYTIYSFANNDRFQGYLYRVVESIDGTRITSFNQFARILGAKIQAAASRGAAGVKASVGHKDDVLAIKFYDQEKPMLIALPEALKVAAQMSKTYRIPKLVQLKQDNQSQDLRQKGGQP